MAIEEQMETLVDRLLLDYDHGRDIDQMELFRNPDRDVVIGVLEKLRRILFPGYFRDRNYRFYNLKYNLSVLIEDVMFQLTRQVSLVFQRQGEKPNQAEQHAQQACLTFLNGIPDIRAMVQTDLQAAYDGDPAATGMDEVIFSYPGLYAISVYRLAHELFRLGVPMIPRMMTEHAHSLTGIDIHPGATIGKYFFIDHGTGIVIGETTIIGDNVKVYQGVTLGALSTRGGQQLRGKKRHPTIEDNVTIYAGASILGGNTVIGAGSVIGSNAFITSSIAPGTTVSIKTQELQYRSRTPDRDAFWDCAL
ncbi:MAG: serine O-acetyltransferase EpsC [Candidatus Faecousia sp.]|nr:serine O-acetyltransferase [Bacillota bacterium]MDY2809841.1 serine O-acetyltransferase EpsC [Candidatus Faecousia sp.]